MATRRESELHDANIFLETEKRYENIFFLKDHLITYIGNKRGLLPFIEEGINEVSQQLGKKKLSILDGFSGSGIVARLLKKYATNLYVNDLETYSTVLNSCYLSNKSEVDVKNIREIIEQLNRDKTRTDLGQGFIEKLYSPVNDDNIKEGERVFYTNRNAKAIDNIRRMLFDVPENEVNFYLAPLLVAASIHANTSGVFKGFYKNKDGIGNFGGDKENCLSRIKKDITLQMPIFSNFDCRVNLMQDNINVVVDKLRDIDIVYYDPPYNQHPYGSNYFMLNLIADYKEPKNISKVSGIPVGWNKSTFNQRTEALQEFDHIVSKTNAKFILISYNNEGIIGFGDLKSMLEKYGEVKVKIKDYSVFKASRNLHKRGKKVKEFLFILKKS
tara:strand:- start:5261 stop:6418 length:1158 start_codon:yes stop_codon:yes gene_type:complete